MNTDRTSQSARAPVTRIPPDASGPSVVVVGTGSAAAEAATALDGDFAVRETSTPSEAIDLLGDGDRTVRCIVSEYHLGETTGVALLERVRERHSTLPFVIYTAHGSEEVASEAVAAGVSQYLPAGDGSRLRERIADITGESKGYGADGWSIREVTNAFPDKAFLFDERGRYLDLISGPETEDLARTPMDRLVGQRLHDVFPRKKADRFLEHIERTLDSGSVETMEYQLDVTSGTRWFEGRTAPLYRRPDESDAVIWVARDVTDRKVSEETVERQRDELTTLTRINGLIHSVLRSLVGSTTRQEIERTVCARLAESEFYRFAWAGQPRLGDAGTIAGLDDAEADRFANALAESTDGPVFEGETVVRELREENPFTPPVREGLIERGVKSVCLVPLAYGRTRFGVLAVGATTLAAFGERELEGLETLGGIVGFAISAAKNRRLLLTDAAVELTFRVDDLTVLFGTISKEFGCQCRLEAVASVSEDRWQKYVSVEGAPPAQVVAAIDEATQVTDYRVVNAEADGCLLEVTMTESGVNCLIEAGGTVTAAVANEGEVRLTAEVSPDTDIRSVAAALKRTYPDSELVCKHEVDGPSQTAWEWQRTLLERLTEKQRTALKTAYLAGYYNHPRDSTAKEVAASMGITSSTLHQHLQAAQRKLLSTFFEE